MWATTSPFEAQKVSTLAGVPNFDYFVAPGHDRMPTTEFYNGFGDAFSDHTHTSALSSRRHDRNLPANRQDLYKPYDSTQGYDGFHKWEDWRISLDIAPIIPNVQLPQAGSLRDVFVAAQCNHDSAQMLHNGMLVADTHVRQKDAGNPIGILFGQPTQVEAAKRGEVLSVPPFSHPRVCAK